MPSVSGSVAKALKEAGNPEDEHEKVEAIAVWIGIHYQRTFVAASHDVASLLAARELDPLGATVLFRAFLEHLGIRSRVILYYRVPDYGWYPLVEILDQDGDHGWDPFGVRYLPDYDGTPRALKDRAAVPLKRLAPSSTRMEVGEDVLTPSLTELRTYPHTSLRLEAVSLFVTELDFTRVNPFDLQAGGVFARQFESLGESLSIVGPLNAGQRFDLLELTPGSTYILQLEWSEGARNNLLLSASGVTTESSQQIDAGVRYQFKAQASSATVSLGAASGSRFKVTSLKWYRP